MDDYDHDKVDEIVLALMYLTLHDYYRAWKGFDWDVPDWLYEREIHQPSPSRHQSTNHC